jgi:hypothetical protein
MPRELTVKSVEAVKPAASRREIADGNVSGLYLVVQSSSGKKSWAVRYRTAGRPRKLTLGSYPAIGLKAARKLASAALEKVAAGGDPNAEKKVARAATPDEDKIENVVVQVPRTSREIKDPQAHLGRNRTRP